MAQRVRLMRKPLSSGQHAISSPDLEGLFIAEGARTVGQTERHDVFERGAERIQLRRSPTIPEAEVDGICDAAHPGPPPMQSFFGD